MGMDLDEILTVDHLRSHQENSQSWHYLTENVESIHTVSITVMLQVGD